MRILFFGFQGWGYEALKALIAKDKNVVGVITHTMGSDTWYGSVEELAKQHDIDTYIFEKIDSGAINVIQKLKPDLILSIGYRCFVPKEVLDMAPAINLHGALLPRYRGGAVLNWAVINGDHKTGVTAHIMTEKFDSGDIVCQKEVPIHFEDTVKDVYDRALVLYPEITLEVIGKIEQGTLDKKPQDESKASYTKQRKPEDGIIDWNKTSIELYNWIRALTHPYPGAFSFLDGGKLLIWKSQLFETTDTGTPGEILSKTTDGFVVKTKDSGIEILQAQIEGENDFFNQSAIKVGDVLG